MILARVVGTVVATRKDPRLEGHTLLIVQKLLEKAQTNVRVQVSSIIGRAAYFRLVAK